MDEDEAKGERTERTRCEDPRPKPFAERADPFAQGGVGMKPQQPQHRACAKPENDAHDVQKEKQLVLSHRPRMLAYESLVNE